MPNNKGQIIVAESGNDIAQSFWTTIFSENFSGGDGAPGNNWTVNTTSAGGGSYTPWVVSSGELYASTQGVQGQTVSMTTWCYRNNEFGSFSAPYRVNLGFKFNSWSKTYRDNSLWVGMGSNATGYGTGILFYAQKYDSYGVQMPVLYCDIYNNGTKINTRLMYPGVELDDTFANLYIEFTSTRITFSMPGLATGDKYEDYSFTFPSNYFVLGYSNDSVNGEVRKTTVDNIQIDKLN